MKSLWKKFRSFISRTCLYTILCICACTTVYVMIIFWEWYLLICALVIIAVLMEPGDDPKEPPRAGPPSKVKRPGEDDS